MKAGDIVNIYQKWITKEDYEGKAKLIRKLVIRKLDAKEVFQSGKMDELWEVKFLDEDYTVTRWILRESDAP